MPNFQTSIETLLESFKEDCTDYLTAHDLVEAYDTLASRIRIHLPLLVEDSPLLEPFKTHSLQITQCLLRDMSCAFDAPFPDSDGASAPSYGVASAEASAEVLTEANIQIARDNILLCHYALRLVSNIFRFPFLYNNFSISSLRLLLESVLSIVSTSPRPLPSFNATKTFNLALWVIQTQRLPAQTVIPKKAEIASVLKDAIECAGRKVNKTERRTRGLEAARAILLTNPLEFLESLAPLLPSILPHLLSSHHNLRHQALLTLNAFGYAKISVPPGSVVEDAMARSVGAFVYQQGGLQGADRISLKTMLEAALASDNLGLPPLTENGNPDASSAVWALGTLSSIVVLSDRYIFSHPRSLRLILPCLGLALAHRRRIIRELQPLAWKGLIWALGRLCRADAAGTGAEGGFGSKVGFGENGKELKARAVRVVMQELGGGNGVDLVAALLNDVRRSGEENSFDGVIEALGVVRALLDHREEGRIEEGRELLWRLLGGVGKEHSSPPLETPRWDWDFSGMLQMDLFFSEDGRKSSSMFECERWSELTSIVRHARRGGVEIGEVRLLEEGEIVRNWAALAGLWVSCVKRELKGDMRDYKPSNEIIHSWQSLLLVQASLTQGRSHLTADNTLGTQIASTLSGFLDLANEGNSVTGLCVAVLGLVRRLWGVVRNVFTERWLKVPSDRMLCVLLKSAFFRSTVSERLGGDNLPAVENEKLEADAAVVEWNRLFEDLVRVGFGEIHEAVCEAVGEGERRVWCLLGKVWGLVGGSDAGSEEVGRWEDAMKIVFVPIRRRWVLTEYEVEAWDDLLRYSISSAGSEGEEPVSVLEHLLKGLEEAELTFLRSSPSLVLIFLSHSNLFNKTQLPPRIPSFINDSLLALYPPHEEYHMLTLEILRAVGDIIASTHCTLVLELLSYMQAGLCSWLVDKEDALEDEEYNQHVIPLYCNALKALMDLPPSIQILDEISPFLSAVFVHHVPPPGLGPGAFERYWRETFHGLDIYKDAYPEEIKLCLKAFDDAFGGSLAVGLEDSLIGTLSQVRPHPRTPCVLLENCIVPDSQDSRSRGFDDHSSQLYAFDDSTSVRGVKNVITTPETTPNKKPSGPGSERVSKSKLQSAKRPDTPTFKSADGRRMPRGPDGLTHEGFAKNYGDGLRGRGSLLVDFDRLDQAGGSRMFLKDGRVSGVGGAGPSTPRSGAPSTSLEPPPIVELVSKAKASKVMKRASVEKDLNPPKRQKRNTSGAGTESVRKASSKRVKQLSHPSPPKGEPQSKPASEPVRQTELSPINTEARAGSQPTTTRKRRSIFDYVEVPPVPDLSRKRRRVELASPLNATSSVRSPVEEDYDTWEANVITADSPVAQGKNGLDDFENEVGVLFRGNSKLKETPSSRRRPPISKSSGLGAGSSRDGRAHTAPLLLQQRASRLPSPMRRAQTTSGQLEALQNAVSAVANDASQLPSEDLVEATRLVNQIGNVLNEQVIRRFNARGKP